MGIAAYNRGSRLIADQVTRQIEASRATNDLRVLLWTDCLEKGVILSFRGAGGAIITVGPNKTAVPSRERFALYRDEGDRRWRGSWFFSTARSAALHIIEHVGRARPYKVVSYG